MVNKFLRGCECDLGTANNSDRFRNCLKDSAGQTWKCSYLSNSNDKETTNACEELIYSFEKQGHVINQNFHDNHTWLRQKENNSRNNSSNLYNHNNNNNRNYNIKNGFSVKNLDNLNRKNESWLLKNNLERSMRFERMPATCDQYSTLEELDHKTTYIFNDILNCNSNNYNNKNNLPINININNYNSVTSQFTIIKHAHSRLFMALTTEEPPSIKYTLKINQQLQYQVWSEDEQLVSTTDVFYKKLTPNHCLNRYSDIVKVLQHADHVWLKKQEAKERESNIILDIITNYETAELTSRKNKRNRKVAFLTEQLALLFTSPATRQFSPFMLSLAASWEQQSPTMYRQMLEDDILTLPKVHQLKSLSRSTPLERQLNESARRFLSGRRELRMYEELSESLALGDMYFQQDYCGCVAKENQVGHRSF